MPVYGHNSWANQNPLIKNLGEYLIKKVTDFYGLTFSTPFGAKTYIWPKMIYLNYIPISQAYIMSQFPVIWCQQSYIDFYSDKKAFGCSLEEAFMNSRTLNLVRAHYDLNLKIEHLLFSVRNFLG